MEREAPNGSASGMLAVVAARGSAWVARRRAPFAATVAMILCVMAYSLVGHFVRHRGHAGIVTPDDLWGLAASSWSLLHGHFAQIYVSKGTLTSPPALEVLLAPVLLVAQASGLVAHYSHQQPMGMWLLMGPVVLLLASPALFAVDAIAECWQLSEGRRLGLALASALGVGTVSGLWGHPEDCIAVAMVLWSALALERDGIAAGGRAAWLLGVGIAFQPLAILAVAPVLARLGWREVARTSWRLALPSLLVLMPPLIAEPGRTRFVLVQQPFMPHYVSFTPLTHLAPVIGSGVDGGGPTRLAATILSACLAIAVCRRRHDLVTVLTMTALAFFIRVLFETELNWYYLWPVMALCLLVSAYRSTWRLACCSAALGTTIWLGDRNTVHHITLWWPELMVLLVVMLVTAGTSRRHRAEPLLSTLRPRTWRQRESETAKSLWRSA
jgi:hypothetical protein